MNILKFDLVQIERKNNNMLHYVRCNPYFVSVAVMLFSLLTASVSLGQNLLPPVTADVVISYGSDLEDKARPLYHYARDEQGREKWTSINGFVTVHDPVRQETRVWSDDSQTYRIFSWNYRFQVQSQSQIITSQTAPPPPSPTSIAASAACPTDPGGWSLAPPPQAQMPYSSASPQQLNIWTCSLYGLPMYMELIDQVFGKVEIQFLNIQPAAFYQAPTSSINPAFEVPSEYVEDYSLRTFPPAGYCNPSASTMVPPAIVISHRYRPGQSVLTDVAPSGCTFVDATAYTGPGVSVSALTFKGQQFFQTLISDTGPYGSGPSLDVARIFLTASDGSSNFTSFRDVIVVRF